MTRSGVLAAALASAALTGCQGAQSAFDPAGVEAERVLTLFWIMLAGGAAIWIVVIGISYYAVKGKSGPYSDRSGIRLIVWGGCVFPVVVLAGLLWWGLTMMQELRRAADGPTIAVSAERFWWRVAYAVDGEPGVIRNLPRGGVPSANEIWIPLGKRTEILLSSPDVIHSFWVPPLAGKIDAIPGRVNRLVLEPTSPGVFNGACAEYCGTAHTYMGFRVVVVPQAEFEAYVASQALPAAVVDGPGAGLFLQNGCAACHTVRGTPADGAVGPDLTHVASRRTIAAGVLPTTVENFAAFIRSTEHLKPGVEMPGFGMLPDEEITAIAKWLGTLE
ncbi:MULTISPECIES: cytochrome c oxidase subunit II [unclassified Hoeflea]|jgi:cytochrome c oxidase subunit 2|uniref:cytochrome c oxidase subunit II n=1 Tax=unclassified Hoeflea TaxID=2614931 RepID=UPI000C10C1BB|nr:MULTISPECIES: cytochrome c oxidase subunit II [unclassified Hoeflea]PHR21966.1 MAG: cytochrome c oxidase subunit II [Hoeflea sp.]VVT35345.1 Cytochrome c oxidase subunit II [Hoeflea sp. EC-HK425]